MVVIKIVGCKCCIPVSESENEKSSTISEIEISHADTIYGYVPDCMQCMNPLYRDVPAKMNSDVDFTTNDITKMKPWKFKVILTFIIAGMVMVITGIGSGVYFGAIKGKVRKLTQKLL